MNIIGAGIDVYADTAQAEGALQRLGQRQTDLLRNSRLFAREYPRNLDQGFTTPMRNFNDVINQSYGNINELNHEVRKLTNQMNSLVMAGVAVSMTGVSFMNFGRTVTDAFTAAIQQATTFEKTMKEVEFLGGLRGQVKEMEKIQGEVMKIGMSLPTTNQKVAEGMVEAMRANFSVDEALKLAPIMSEMAFLSFDKMTEADSLKMMNTWLKTTARGVDDARMAFDKFAKTSDIFTTDLDGINRAFQSTRAAFDTLQLGNQEMGEESFLSLIGMMSTQFNPRAAGQMINSFSRGLAQAFGTDAGTKRGDLWRALGIDYEAEDDILATMDKISKRSIEIWGDTKDRQEKLIDLFGVEGLPVLQMIEKFNASGQDIYAMRDSIKDSAGYSEEYMDHIMQTSYGTQQILKGTKETLTTLIGLTILGPINKILMGLANALGAIGVWVQANPQIAKFISLLVLSVGVLSTVTGGVLLFTGAIMAMYGSIGSAVMMMGQMGASQAVLEKGFTSLGSIMNHTLLKPMKQMLWGMARLTLASGLLFLAWKHDFMGMRTYVNQLFSSFNRGRELAGTLFADTSMSWDAFQKQVQKEDPLTAWFTDKFVKAKAFSTLIRGLWDDNEITADEVGGEAELRRLHKIWEETGMLDLADTILDWRTNIQAFWDGFLKGGEQARDILLPMFKTLGDILAWVYDAAVWVGQQFGFLNKDAEHLAPKFEKIGTVLGTIAGVAGGITLAFMAWRKTLGPIVGILAKLAGFGMRSFGTFRGFFGGRGNGPKGGGPRGGGFRAKAGDFTRRTVAKGLLLDRAFPGTFGKDGRVRNPAHAPKGSSRLERNQSGFHSWAWRRGQDRTMPRRSLADLPQYGYSTQRSNRGPIAGQRGTQLRTLNSRTLGGVMRDVLFGRRVDVSQNKNGGYSYRQRNEHGQVVSRNVKGENLRQNRRGEVRTGRGLLTGNIFYQGGSAVARRVRNTQTARNIGTGLQMYGQRVRDSQLVRNVGRQTATRSYNTTGVRGAQPGQQHVVRERGGYIGGMMDTAFGSKTYNQDGKYVGRTRQNAQGQRSFRKQGKVGRAMGGAKDILGGLFNVIRSQGPKAGKLLGKVLMAPLKLGLRAIPLVGQLLLAWDIISAVWSNWDSIKAGAAKAWEWIQTKAGQVWEWIKTTGAPAMWEGFKAFGAWAWEHIKSLAGSAWNGITTLASMAWEIITNYVRTKIDEWKTTALSMWDWVSTKASEVWNSITTYVTTAIENWKTFLLGIWDAALTKANEIWATITGTVETTISSWSATLEGIWEGMKTAFYTAWDAVVSYAANNPVTRAVNWVIDKLPGGDGPAPSSGGGILGYRTGLHNVGNENQLAYLHRGEMVLTRREAQVLRAMSGTRSIFDTLMEASSGKGMRTGGTVKGRRSIKSLETQQPVQTANTGGGNTSIHLGKVDIHVENMTDPKEIEKGAKQLFEKFQRMVELENTRNYRLARER